MNFELTQEQTMLRDALARFLADRCGFEQRRALHHERLGWSRSIWSWLAEQGYLGVSFAEADGGLGGGPVETMAIAEVFGRHLAAEPYLAAVILAGTAIRLGANPSARAETLSELASGTLIAAVGFETSGTMHAKRNSTQWRLSGTVSNVVHGDCADRLLVTADTTEGLGVFLVDVTAVAIERRCYATFDGLRAADIALDDAPAMLLALGTEAEQLVERVTQHGIAFLAAEAVGIMRRLLELTVDHLKTRRQFEQALSDFQVLRHKAVDMLVATEQAESAKIYAATMADHVDAVERCKAFAAVKAVIGGAARTVGQAAVQLHGGIGVTDEHYVGWGMRRLTMIEMQLGDSDHHIMALADAGGFLAAAG